MQSNKTFQIAARTVTLGADKQTEADFLLKPGISFHIPIFQRPYSWGKTEIDKFIADLFTSFWGIGHTDDSESLFIGTMQLTDVKKNEEYGDFFDVIDGQQRLTTCLILLRVLQLLFPKDEIITQLSLDWLHSSVSNGAQQSQLNEFLALKNLDGLVDEQVNRFKINAVLIAEVVAKQTRPFEDDVASFNPAAFTHHLFTNVYFVVIQTKASLTKTLQIFKAINTTGLDLNGEDIFKLRMFEYLKDRDSSKTENEIFLEVSLLYTVIENTNKAYRRPFLSMSKALNIYKFVLIQRLGLPKVLYDMGTDSFFENLFDAVSRSAQPEHFTRMGDPKLSCNDIKDIINVMIQWEDLDYPSVEDECLMHFIWNSRYGRFDTLKFLFLYHYKDDPAAGEKLFPFLNLLAKLYWCYSVIFHRRVYHLLTWTYNSLDVLMTKSYEEALEAINKALSGNDQYGRNLKYEVGRVLDGGITSNYRTKTLICRISAMLDEQYLSGSDRVKKEVIDKLFGDTFDVEHIQSAKDSDLINRPQIAKEWENEIDTIGNLVALEQKINRGIGNIRYEKKRTAYLNSKFASIKLILDQYPQWSRVDCIERQKFEKHKIIYYVFGS